ncbi:MAG: hypothetical protein ACTTIA_06850 [Candidatus Cryptobacteroides sp.]
MEEKKKQHKNSIRFFNDREVRAVWDDEHNKWWFSVLDVIAAINEQDDYQKTRNYWKYLKTKLKKENNEPVSGTNQFKLQAPDGKLRVAEVLNSESVSDSAHIKALVLPALTTKIDDREMFMKGIDYSYYYEQTD